VTGPKRHETQRVRDTGEMGLNQGVRESPVAQYPKRHLDRLNHILLRQRDSTRNTSCPITAMQPHNNPEITNSWSFMLHNICCYF